MVGWGSGHCHSWMCLLVFLCAHMHTCACVRACIHASRVRAFEGARGLASQLACLCRLCRFPTLTGNIRKRRGEKVEIRVPLFMDENTDPHLSQSPNAIEGDPPHIYLDCMAFGMGVPRHQTQTTFFEVYFFSFASFPCSVSAV